MSEKKPPIRNAGAAWVNYKLTPEDERSASKEEREQLVTMRASVTYWQDAMRRFRRNKVAMLSLCLLIIIMLFAFIGPMFSPYTYEQQIRGSENLSPSLEHPFGTDALGRDLLVRNMMGARISLLIGIIASVIILVIGTVYGAVSGYAGGWTDTIMMRVVEVLYAVPTTLIVILLRIALREPLDQFFMNSTLFSGMRGFGSGLISIFITFALLYWVSMARMVRGEVLVTKQSEYVSAAQALGASRWRVIFKHLLPNSMGTIMVTALFQIPSAIFTESFLSFLGLGVAAPMASLGSLASDALQGLQTYPYRMLFPAVILSLIILAFNQFGDGLRDALDPRLRD